MRARPIGTTPIPARASNMRRKPLRSEPQPVTGPADLYPVTVRISGGPLKGKSHSFSRLIITDTALYLATSPDKGRTVDTVYRFALPSGNRVTTAAKKGSWGVYSWSGCGCVNSWGSHSRGSLIALGDNPQAPAPEPAPSTTLDAITGIAAANDAAANATPTTDADDA